MPVRRARDPSRACTATLGAVVLAVGCATNSWTLRLLCAPAFVCLALVFFKQARLDTVLKRLSCGYVRWLRPDTHARGSPCLVPASDPALQNYKACTLESLFPYNGGPRITQVHDSLEDRLPKVLRDMILGYLETTLGYDSIVQTNKQNPNSGMTVLAIHGGGYGGEKFPGHPQWDSRDDRDFVYCVTALVKYVDRPSAFSMGIEMEKWWSPKRSLTYFSHGVLAQYIRSHRDVVIGGDYPAPELRNPSDPSCCKPAKGVSKISMVICRGEQWFIIDRVLYDPSAAFVVLRSGKPGQEIVQPAKKSRWDDVASLRRTRPPPTISEVNVRPRIMFTAESEIEIVEPDFGFDFVYVPSRELSWCEKLLGSSPGSIRRRAKSNHKS